MNYRSLCTGCEATGNIPLLADLVLTLRRSDREFDSPQWCHAPERLMAGPLTFNQAS